LNLHHTLGIEMGRSFQKRIQTLTTIVQKNNAIQTFLFRNSQGGRLIKHKPHKYLLDFRQFIAATLATFGTNGTKLITAKVIKTLFKYASNTHTEKKAKNFVKHLPFVFLVGKRYQTPKGCQEEKFNIRSKKFNYSIARIGVLLFFLFLSSRRVDFDPLVDTVTQAMDCARNLMYYI